MDAAKWTTIPGNINIWDRHKERNWTDFDTTCWVEIFIGTSCNHFSGFNHDFEFDLTGSAKMLTQAKQILRTECSLENHLQ